MEELQGKKLINLTGLQAFWNNVVIPRFNETDKNISDAVRDLEEQISVKADQSSLDALSQTVGTKVDQSAFDTFSQNVETALNGKAEASVVNGITERLNKFNSGEDTIETVIAGIKTDIENVAAEASVISIKGGDATDDLVQITVAGTENAGAYQGNVTVSINDAKLVEALGTKAAQSDLEAAVDRIDTAEGKIEALEGAVDALSSATDFIGVTTTEISDGSTTNPIKINEQDYSAVKGDIVIYGNKEFIWDGEKWVELGDTTALAQKITALEEAGEEILTNLDTAKGRIDTAENNITALENAVSAIQPLTLQEVEDAFNDGWEPAPV